MDDNTEERGDQPPLREGLTANLMVRIENSDEPVSSEETIVDILMDSLLFMRKVRNDYPELRNERCPKILIDGLFRVREAQFCLRDGSMLELTNEERFWEFGKMDGWEDLDPQVKWNDMLSLGLASDFDLPASGQNWPSPKFETINNETLEGSTVELAKRVMNCFWAI
jgi:hypothetical protein